MLRGPLLLSFGAGLLAATGFAPLGWWPVTLAGIAVLLWLVHRAPRLRDALLLGWGWGVGHFTLGDNWIQHAFTYQDKMPHWLGYLAVVLLALYLAVYPALAAGLIWRFGETLRLDRARLPAAVVLAAGASWIVSEWLRAELFTGYSWNPLGVIWLALPGIAARAAWIGTYGLSGVAVVAGGALVLAAQRQWRFAAATALLLGLAAATALFARPDTPAPNAPLVRIVQPNIGQEGVDDPFYPEHVLRTLIALSGEPGPRPRLVVWPEGMVMQWLEDGYPPALYSEGNPDIVRGRIAAVLGTYDMALVGGERLFLDASGRHITGAGNTVFVIGPAGRLGARYDKAHLVPYGEYLPMRPLLEPLGLARLVMGDVDFDPGPGPRSLAVPGFGLAGIQICYEIIFSGQVIDTAHRPAFLFNPSNDAWFGSWGPPQHLAQARMRAIEEAMPILRATPTGISAVIDADGRLVATLPHGRAGAIEVPLPPPHAPTPFALAGNWLVFLFAGLLLALAVAFGRRAR
jgi:apolipoprotein N-acyltransferase